MEEHFLLRVCIYAAMLGQSLQLIEVKSPKSFATTLGHPRSEWIDLRLCMSSVNEIWLESVYINILYSILYIYILDASQKSCCAEDDL